MILGNPITLGGTSKAFAVISVTYPEGSTCTCSDGTKTLKLKDTSGQGLFLIPYAATWTVTCTDGINTAYEAVEITSEGQSVSMKLSYWDGTIFADGDQYADITGGWTHNDTAVVGYGTGMSGDMTTNTMKITFSGNTGACAWNTIKKIDLTEFSQLEVTFKTISNTSFESLMITAKQEIGTADSHVTNFILAPPGTFLAAQGKWTGTTPYTSTFSLEGLNGEYYIGWGAAMSMPYRGAGSAEVSKIQLR